MGLSAIRRRFSAVVAILLLAIALAPNARGQAGKASITGHIVDSAGGVLQGASVKLEPGGLSVVSDSQGQFAFGNLAAGAYTLTISYSGFSHFSKSITLAAGQSVFVDATLQVAPANQEISVHADLQGEAEEIQVQRTSENILNVIDADVITSLPNANIADAVGRLPGVTLERDEGEGKYVQVRGTEPRLTNVTIDGVNVPSPEATVRQVKLDVIPADLVDSIELNKTLSADQDGDAIGGSVNLKLKTAGDQPTFIVSGIAGYTPILGGRDVDQISSTIGQRFGSSKQFGALFGFTYDYNGRGIDDIEPAVDPCCAVPFYDSVDLREYRYQRHRWGLGGSADYRLSQESDIYFHYLYSDFKDYGNKWVYTLANQATPQAPTAGMCGPNMCSDVFKTSQRVPDYAIGSIALGGKHNLTNSWLAWDVSVSKGRQTEAAGNPGVTFDYVGSANCYYDPQANSSKLRPQFNAQCTAPGSGIFDPTQYQMVEFDTTYGPTEQINIQGSVAFGKNYSIGTHSGTLEFGVKVRNGHKYQSANSPIWDPVGTYLMSDFLSGFKANEYYDNQLTFGPVTSYNKLNNFFLQNPQNFTEDVSDTHLSNDPNNYNLTERVTAGFIQNTLQFGRFRLQTGLRLEATQLYIQGFETQTDPATGDWASTSQTHANNWYVDPLPSVQLRYAVTPDSDIRGVYGRGLSRPDPYDLVPYIVLDQSTNPANVALGNPNLKAEHANDFDVLYEHYLKPYGVIQAGYFYKQLIDPIYYTSSLPQTTGLYAGYSITQIINGSDAHVGGVELAYLQHFSSLPGLLNGLGLAANYTYTYSRGYGLPGRTDVPALQRQAPQSFNIIPSYDRGRFSMHLGLTYNSAMIYQYQYTTAGDSSNLGVKGPAGDIYLYPHFQVDGQATFRVTHGLTLLVEGENMTNEVFGFYNGSPIYVDQREYYKPTISAGFRWYPLRKD